MLDLTFVPVGIGKYALVNLDSLAILPIMHRQVSSLQHGAPGYETGLRPGDVVMGVAGEAGVSKDRLVEAIKANEGKPIRCL